jgi:hypothetical protein
MALFEGYKAYSVWGVLPTPFAVIARSEDEKKGLNPNHDEAIGYMVATRTRLLCC